MFLFHAALGCEIMIIYFVIKRSKFITYWADPISLPFEQTHDEFEGDTLKLPYINNAMATWNATEGMRLFR